MKLGCTLLASKNLSQNSYAMSMLYDFLEILIAQSVKHIKRVCAIRFSSFGIIIWEVFHNLCILSDERENILDTELVKLWDID